MFRITFFLSLVLICTACLKSTLKDGEASLEGVWQVNQVSTWTGEFTENGAGGLLEKIETGNLNFWKLRLGADT